MQNCLIQLQCYSNEIYDFYTVNSIIGKNNFTFHKEKTSLRLKSQCVDRVKSVSHSFSIAYAALGQSALRPLNNKGFLNRKSFTLNF
jgi:hypothetical protein